MQNSIFYSVRPKAGDIMWALPIRWWEINKPHRVEILTDCKENDKQLYCMSDLYGHSVYIDRTFTSYKKETVIKVIMHLRMLEKLMVNDGMDILVDRCFEDEPK